MSAGQWPPPVTASTRWQRIRLPRAPITDRGEEVRQVRLWGQVVWVNAAGAVYCPGCGDFRTTDELSGPLSTCSVGLRRGAIEGPKVVEDTAFEERDGALDGRAGDPSWGSW